MLSSRGLQYSSEETVGEGEARQPEQVGGLSRFCPVCKLIDSLAKIPGPRCQGLQRGVRLVDRDSDARERVREKMHGKFIVISCSQLMAAVDLINTSKGMQEGCGSEDCAKIHK